MLWPGLCGRRLCRQARPQQQVPPLLFSGASGPELVPGHFPRESVCVDVTAVSAAGGVSDAPPPRGVASRAGGGPCAHSDPGGLWVSPWLPADLASPSAPAASQQVIRPGEPSPRADCGLVVQLKSPRGSRVQPRTPAVPRGSGRGLPSPARGWGHVAWAALSAVGRVFPDRAFALKAI